MKRRPIAISVVVIAALLALLAAFSPKSAQAMPVRVRAGGFPIAMVLNVDGAIVDEVGFVKTAVGNATLINKLKKGDTILEIDGDKISSCDDVLGSVEEGGGKEMKFTLLRDGKRITTAVTPYIEDASGMFRLGVYIRDTVTGIGTVTYIKENGCFGALGHRISDMVATYEVPISGGKVYDCTILGITPSGRGVPGEIKAAIKGESIGEVFSCNDFGVYGKFYSVREGELKEIGSRGDVKPGKAYILSTVDGSLNAYEVDIIKTSYQSEATQKGMLIRVTDKRLLSLTGGIVRGMSGSPIMQNGYIIGAVTHVLIGDPTKGYAVYAEWMTA